MDEVGAVFAHGRAHDGVRFGPGEYELLKGLVHLRFAQGADVVLAGPARLDVTDAQRIRLMVNRIWQRSAIWQRSGLCLDRLAVHFVRKQRIRLRRMNRAAVL